MILVNIDREKDQVKKVSIQGHAKYADYGKDIVCSACSSIVTTTVNAILSFDESAIWYDAEQGNLEIKVKKQDDITKKLIENMIQLLKELENNYPKNIKVE